MWSVSMAHGAGCRGAIGSLEHAWGELMVVVPGEPAVPELDATTDALAAHGLAGEAVRKARSRRQRLTWTGAVEQVEAWIAANPDALGLEPVRAAVESVRARCATP